MPETLYLAIFMDISLINHGSKWRKNEYAENKYQTYEYTNNEQDVWSKKKQIKSNIQWLNVAMESENKTKQKKEEEFHMLNWRKWTNIIDVKYKQNGKEMDVCLFDCVCVDINW